MVITRSTDEEIDADEDDEVTDPTDSVVTHSQEIVDDPDATEVSGVPFWAVEAETERVRLPLPPDAFPTPGPTVIGIGGAEAEARAVTFFDLGIALRAQHRDAEALEAWEKALALAPEDPIYKESVRRLRAHIHS